MVVNVECPALNCPCHSKVLVVILHAFSQGGALKYGMDLNILTCCLFLSYHHLAPPPLFLSVLATP